jgi:hypothetical protein
MRRLSDFRRSEDSSFLGKLQANAERLVRVRPVGEAPGDDTAAVLARAETRVARGDIAAALAALGTLPAQVRAPAESWIKTAQARDAAFAASRRYAAGAVNALAQRSP